MSMPSKALARMSFEVHRTGVRSGRFSESLLAQQVKALWETRTLPLVARSVEAICVCSHRVSDGLVGVDQ